ncbi:hypothetical protein L873DRAFT_364342 [Choiromyces venosus 120613-1]|uniref:Uncharacterized protein n=1 Tax=Choiromyces venosus 120613-1 TaxID=1336337 RepID=A0A3N4JWL1_9PEZI|nr:hypothetical protein L873DRAFT_364342 [Choiromyces venosus 120613-1]
MRKKGMMNILRYVFIFQVKQIVGLVLTSIWEPERMLTMTTIQRNSNLKEDLHPPAHGYEVREDSLIEILEDESIVSGRSNSRLESPVSTQQSPLTNKQIPQINIRSKQNRSRSVEVGNVSFSALANQISKEVSGFIVETRANTHKGQDSDNTHSINLLDDLP